MDFSEMSVRAFTERLASKAPVPGGGGASALVGALGVALGDMVGALTVGKKKYAGVEDDIRALMARASGLREALLDCIERDAAAFEPLSRAYGIPKDDPGRDAALERCLRDAAEPPMAILGLCGEAVEVLRDFAEKGSAMVISDAATGVMFCHAAMHGAAVNVRVNTRLMKDRAYAEALDRRVEALLAQYAPMAEAVFGQVFRGRL